VDVVLLRMLTAVAYVVEYCVEYIVEYVMGYVAGCWLRPGCCQVAFWLISGCLLFAVAVCAPTNGPRCGVFFDICCG
jgi:hypothetical protein